MLCPASSDGNLNIAPSTMLTAPPKPDKREKKKEGLLLVVQVKKDRLDHGLYLGDLT